MISISGNTLEELEEQLERLKRDATRPRTAAPPVVNGQLRGKIVELKRRATKTTGQVWKLVRAVAARRTPSTLDELAHDLGLPHAGSVHSLLAVLGRPCAPARLNITVIENIGGNPTRYTMPENVRDIVTELGD